MHVVMSLLITVAVWRYYCNRNSNLVFTERGSQQILWLTNSPIYKQFPAYLTLHISRAITFTKFNSNLLNNITYYC